VVERDEAEEQLVRTEWWDTQAILGIMGQITCVMSDLEMFIRSNQWETAEANDTEEGNAAKAVLQILSSTIPLLQGIFAYEASVAEDIAMPGVAVREDATSEEQVVERTSANDKQTNAIESSIAALRSELEARVLELETKLQNSESEKAQLVDRVSKLENAPATLPGNQLVDVKRSRSKHDEYQEAVKRAKDKGDTQELIKLQILGKFHGWVTD
jgi:hypothetical protein